MKELLHVSLEFADSPSVTRNQEKVGCSVINGESPNLYDKSVSQLSLCSQMWKNASIEAIPVTWTLRVTKL